MTDFINNLFTSYTNLLSKHLGTDNFNHFEDSLISKLFLNTLKIKDYLDSLEQIPVYFEINRLNINSVYNGKISQTDYFNYHYDNFIVLSVTSLDILGKLGNLLYELGIQDRYCNWHSFAYHRSMQNTLPSKKLIEFSDYLESFKLQRHSKLHWGQRVENNFEYILMFGDIHKPPGLIHLTDEAAINQQIIIEINAIEKAVKIIIKYTFDFLDSMNSKLEELLSVSNRSSP